MLVERGGFRDGHRIVDGPLQARLDRFTGVVHRLVQCVVHAEAPWKIRYHPTAGLRAGACAGEGAGFDGKRATHGNVFQFEGSNRSASTGFQQNRAEVLAWARNGHTTGMLRMDIHVV